MFDILGKKKAEQLQNILDESNNKCRNIFSLELQES